MTKEEITKQLETYWLELEKFALDSGLLLLKAAAVVVVGWWLINKLIKGIRKALERKEVDNLVKNFLLTLTRIILRITLLVFAAEILGLNTNSLIAVIGAAGLAVGLALQSTLGNFAGGVMILFFRPFKEGDYVETQGEKGYIFKVQLFNTTLKTLDNKVVIIPNGNIVGNNIVNYTMQTKRRVDLQFGISYSDDIKKVKQVLEETARKNPMVLKEDEAFTGLIELADSSVNVVLRVWVKTDDYWTVFFDLNEACYLALKDAGITIPFPQLDVHMQGK